MVKYAKLPFNEGIMNDDSVLFGEFRVGSDFQRWEGTEKSERHTKLAPGQQHEGKDVNAITIKDGVAVYVLVPDDEPVFPW